MNCSRGTKSTSSVINKNLKYMQLPELDYQPSSIQMPLHSSSNQLFSLSPKSHNFPNITQFETIRELEESQEDEYLLSFKTNELDMNMTELLDWISLD
ncbi:hypothetical protein SS50377_20964 [Spironucleus salmonicida]|uniref:Uncharacterized protein n=1 Tax=Spironucleus salmonicida TaxID=348837 RepID=V6LS79_9EUKA|nr:hypothetical protein SS50377_20964 [Spironucleus salmonicida]|eukprot:EST43634.1 Hypothetical protein SS50377_16677 [Spironucleus salmonicida]